VRSRAAILKERAVKGRLLLVEDDPGLTELLRWHFEREEFDVDHTPDGEEALMLAKESPPDIVLLDWMIEGISGIEVCRRLRRSAGTSNVPIIMLTGRGEEQDRVRGLETGADDYVTKPFSPRELVARVGAVLRRVRPALAGEQLCFSDLEMNIVSHKVRRSGKTVALGPRPNSGCCGTSWSIPAGSSRASGCSTRCGRATARLSRGPWTCISGA
jgi:two-component system phosphate regulon response regulator PhoB